MSTTAEHHIRRTITASLVASITADVATTCSPDVQLDDDDVRVVVTAVLADGSVEAWSLDLNGAATLAMLLGSAYGDGKQLIGQVES